MKHRGMDVTCDKEWRNEERLTRCVRAGATLKAHKGKGIKHGKRCEMHTIETTGHRFVRWATGMCDHLVAWRSVITSEAYWGSRIQQLSSRGFQELVQRDGCKKYI